MTLPLPSEEEGRAFQALYKTKFSLELSSKEAYEVARKVMGIIYVQRKHPVHPLCEEEL